MKATGLKSPKQTIVNKFNKLKKLSVQNHNLKEKSIKIRIPSRPLKILTTKKTVIYK